MRGGSLRRSNEIRINLKNKYESVSTYITVSFLKNNAEKALPKAICYAEG